MNIRLCLVLACVFLTMPAQADVITGCNWKGQVLKVDEIVWIPNPKLVAIQAAYFEKKGHAPDKAVSLAKKAEWVGYRLECRRLFDDELEPAGFGMALIESQRGVLSINKTP